MTLNERLAALGTVWHGLSAREAGRRLARVGPNTLAGNHRRWRALCTFLSRFQNPLVLLLIVAGGISALVHERASLAIISIMVLASVTLDYLQEYRAGQAVERLKASIASRASVLRDGKATDVPIAELVPGDVVLLSAGDRVPADGELMEARDLFVSQSLLTGEPYPVEKRVDGGLHPAEPPDLACSMLFMGSSIISGSARLLVCQTGMATYLGGVAGTLAQKPPATAFEQGTRQFGLLIMRLTLLMVLLVLFANTFIGHPWLDMFLFAMALAVGLTPELLPMVVSVTLANGALRMARKKVVVKRLAAIQDLGSMDVLCTDKTGTLTEARIRLERHVNAEGRPCQSVLELAYLNSCLETGLRSPLDEAILQHGEIDISGWTKIDEVPFDFERRRVSVLVDDGVRRRIVVKGAPEDILALSARFLKDGPGTDQPLDATARSSLARLYDQLSDEGFRSLGIAYRDVDRGHDHAVVDDESELVFAGYAAFLDPAKPEAGETLAGLAAHGVTVKIVTGDNERVTQRLCAHLGIAVEGVLMGHEIASLDDPGLQAAADRANLFCRVTPSQKSRIISALRQRGNVVGFLGDGINDAPSLHVADVGISVDTAVDVAREAADMILLEHDLRVLHQGVLEGRRTLGNIMKYIMMGASSNFGNMLSMAAATLWLPFLPMLPTQILLNNFLYDASEIPIPLDQVDEEFLARPRRWNMDEVRRFMLAMGPVSSLFDAMTFTVMLTWFNAGESLFQTGWFVESLATQILVIFIIRTSRNPFRSSPSPWLAGTCVLTVILAAGIPYTPVGALFGFVPLPPAFFAVLAAIVVAYLGLVETVKRQLVRRHLLGL